MHSAHCIYAALCIVQHNRLQGNSYRMHKDATQLCSVTGCTHWPPKLTRVHFTHAMQGSHSALKCIYCILCDAVRCMAQITLRCTDRNCRHPSLSVASIPPTMSHPPIPPTMSDSPIPPTKSDQIYTKYRIKLQYHQISLIVYEQHVEFNANHKRQRYPSLNATNQVRLNTSNCNQ